MLNATLPLELARLNIAAARTQDPDQRLNTYAIARAQLNDYIAKNKGKGQAALAKVDVARLTTYDAQILLSKAMREEDNRERHAKARPAEEKFIQAGKEVEDAIKLLDAAAQDSANAALKSTLTQELRQARFDLAINLFDQAKTYINRENIDVSRQRGQIITKASKAFIALRSDESTQIGWLANAWLMKCAMETDAPDDVRKYYKLVMDRANDKSIQANIQPAVRLVRYFHMQDQTLPRQDEPETMGINHISGNIKKRPTQIDRLKAVQKEGEAWLKAYPNRLKSYEGQGVRFELAHAYLGEAKLLENDKNQKDKKLVENLFKQAAMHFKILGDYDGELAYRSRDISMRLETKVVSEGKTELKTFDQFLMKGMVERKNVRDIAGKLDDPKVDAERKRHLKEAINAYSKAISLADGKTPLAKLDDARYYLCGAYLAYGDPYRGAIVAESLGRSRLNSRGAEGAATAIATYAALHDRHPDDAAIKNRMHDLAEFVLSPQAQKSWAGNPVTSRAHYHLGLAAKQENNPKKAIGHLEKIAPDFTDYVYTQGQLAFIAEAARTATDDKAEQKWYAAAARAAIKRMPKIQPKNEAPAVIAMYFFAKLEDSKYQYAAAFEDMNARQELKAIKKFNDMAEFVKGLRTELDQVPAQARLELEEKDRAAYVAGDPPPEAGLKNGDRISEISGKEITAISDVIRHASKLAADDTLTLTVERNNEKRKLDIKAGLVKDVPKGKISQQSHEQLQFTMKVMLKYADLGIAEVRFRGDNKDRFDQVLAATKSVVDETLAKAKATPAGENINMKDYRVTSDILSLALRANVQKGDVAKGKAILEVLQRVADENGVKKSGNVVAVLLSDIAGQIKRMKETKDPALQATKGNYTAFLDVIAAELDAKGYDHNSAVLMGHAYSSLELPQKAAAVFAKYKAPAVVDKKIDKKGKLTEDEEADLSRYWGIRVEYVRALRACKDGDSLKKATAVLDDLFKHPNARFKMYAEMEKNHIFEDQQKYRQSLQGWNGFLKGLQPQLAKPEVQKIYFPAYVDRARVMYKLGTMDKDSPPLKDPGKYVTGAAKYIVDLEFAKSREGWIMMGPAIQNMLKDPEYDKLKKEYDRLKALEGKGASLWNLKPNENVAPGICREGEAPAEPEPWINSLILAGSGSAGASPSRHCAHFELKRIDPCHIVVASSL